MNGFAVGGEDAMGNPGRLVVLDMMGYGKGSHDDWGTEIMKYLVGRKQYPLDQSRQWNSGCLQTLGYDEHFCWSTPYMV